MARLAIAQPLKHRANRRLERERGRQQVVAALGQQALLDLKLLRDKPDGFAGPNTRNAIKAFQKSIGQAESGEPTREVFAALQAALAKREGVAPKP